MSPIPSSDPAIDMDLDLVLDPFDGIQHIPTKVSPETPYRLVWRRMLLDLLGLTSSDMTRWDSFMISVFQPEPKWVSQRGYSDTNNCQRQGRFRLQKSESSLMGKGGQDMYPLQKIFLFSKTAGNQFPRKGSLLRRCIARTVEGMDTQPMHVKIQSDALLATHLGTGMHSVQLGDIHLTRQVIRHTLLFPKHFQIRTISTAPIKQL